MTASAALSGHHGLDALMRPRSIAIVGASDDPARIGGRPLAYLRRAGFAGPIHPVNPARSAVQGIPAWPDLDALPMVPDLVIVAVSAAATLEVAATCVRRCVPAMLVFSADFADSGAAGRARQDRLQALVAGSGVRVLGPNCLGAFNTAHRLFATFSSAFEASFPVAGNVGIVSQSGGYGGHIATVCERRGVRVGQWITTGNEADLDVAECLDWMAHQPDIEVLLMYLEGVASRDRLVGALATARALGKPVLVVKAGTSSVGAQAAHTHTAVLAGADRVFDGMLRQWGALRMPDTEAMVDAAYLLQRCPRGAGRRVGIASISGAVGVQLADGADLAGLCVPELPLPAQRTLRELNRFAAPRNPVDITAQAFNEMALVTCNLETMLEAGNFDALVAYFGVTAGSPTLGPKLVAALSPLPARHPRIPMLLCIFAPLPIVRAFEEAGFAVFEDPARVMAALGRTVWAPAGLPALQVDAAAGVGAAAEAGAAVDQADSARQRLLAHDGTENSAKELLHALGVPTPPRAVAGDEAEAARAAQRLGFPVAVKVHGRGILHKSELGGVELGLADAAAVEAAARAMRARIGAACEGFLVERMAGRGVECIVGLQHDAQLGPMVAIGFGGVMAELFHDVAIRLIPLSRADVRAALAQLRAAPLLDGWRGRPACDVDALCDAVVRLASFFAANAQVVETIEVNPLVVLPRGSGVVACDAVVVSRRQPGTRT